MTAKEFHEKIYDIIINSETPEIQKKEANNFFKQLKEEQKEYARIKCLEAIKNTRHNAVDILQEQYFTASMNYIAREIQNTPNQDVMPEL